MRKKLYDYVPLSNRTKEIILGSLLGDGSIKIHKGYKNARFSFRHSYIQKEYFYWKVNLLKEISSSLCVFEQENDGGYSKQKKLRYQSLAKESLTDLYNLTHKQKKVEIKRKWLNRLSPLSLAIWWQDDGSIIANGRKGVFCTDGFSEKQVKTIAQYLNVVWSIKTSVSSIKKSRDAKKEEYYRIFIHSTSELKKFLQIILPYIEVEQMLPKVILMYNDNYLQQRWISEICKSTNFSKETVEKYLKIKKGKWKQFQKKI